MPFAWGLVVCVQIAAPRLPFFRYLTVKPYPHISMQNCKLDYYSLCQDGYVTPDIYLLAGWFICFLAKLHKKLQTDLAKISRKARKPPNPPPVTFCVNQIKSNHLFRQADTKKTLIKWVMKRLEQGYKGLQEPLTWTPKKEKKTYE